VASEHWRDLHREQQGRFKPRPGAKGFKPDDKPPRERGPTPFHLWVQKVRGGAGR
jgi:hypothetical protein